MAEEAIFRTVIQVDDSAIQRAITEAFAAMAALETKVATGGTSVGSAQQQLAASAAQARQLVATPGLSPDTYSELQAFIGLAEEEFRRLAGETTRTTAVTKEWNQAVRDATARMKRETADRANKAADPEDPKNRRDVIAKREEGKARDAQIIAGDDEIKDSQFQRLAAANETRADLAQDLARDEANIGNQARRELAAKQQRLAILQRTLSGDNQLLQVQAQTLVEAKKVQIAERQLARATLKAAIESGELGRGSFGQRVQAGIANRSGGPVRAPQEFATTRQLLTGSAVTTARFAASGALLYGGIQGIRTMINEAEELERIFNQIERQFQSLGQTDAFGGFREGILAIARETGAAGDQVAFVGFQLQGAFGGNTQRALAETESAFKAVRVTGLEITEVIDAFTALTQNFDASNVTIAEVSDTALGLQERFGVLAKETISFAADLAPVAAAAGFTVQELEALGAVGQKYSGRSGSSLAEAFGRILPAIQGNAVQFVQLFEQLGDSDLAGQVTEAFRTGDISQFFDILLRNYDDLSGAQKNYVIELLGGRREAQALIPILENSAELVSELDRAQSDAGKTNAYFADLQQTLNQRLAEFGEQLSQLGVDIFNAGLGEFLTDIINLGSGAVDILSALIGVVSDLGGALSQIPGVGGGLSAILQAVLLYKGVGAISGRLGGGAAAAAAATAVRPSPYLANAAAGAASGAAQQAGIRQAMNSALGGSISASMAANGFRATAGNIATGFKNAMAGFNWGAIGVAAGLIAVQQIAGGIAQSSRDDTAAKLGDDARANNLEIDELGAEFDVDSGEVLALRQRIIDEGGTLADFHEALADLGDADRSVWQRIISGESRSGRDTLLPNLSKDDQDNKNAAQAIADEQKQRYIDRFSELAASDEILNEIVESAFKDSDLPEAERTEQVGVQVAARRDELNAIIAQLEAGDDVSLPLIQNLIDQYAEEAPRAQRAIAARIAREERELLDQSTRMLEASEALSMFEAGDIGAPEARQALQQAISTRRDLGFGTGDANQRKELADLIKREKDFQSEVLINEVESLVEANELFGGTPQQNLDLYLGLLRTGNLTPGDAQTASKGAIDALQAVFDAELALADTATERARLLANGIPVPRELRVELAYQYLSTASVAYQEFIFTATGGLKELADAITRTAAEIYAAGGKSWTEAVTAAIMAQVAVLEMKRAAIHVINDAQRNMGAIRRIQRQSAEIDAQIADLMGNIPNVPQISGPSFDTFGVDAAGAAAAQKQALEEQKRAEEEWLRALAEEAQRRQGIALARLDLQKAFFEGDAAELALIDISIANQELAFARGNGDVEGQIRAQASLVRANRARQEALSAIGNAQRDLSQAGRGDDPLGAAFVGILDADAALALARGAEERLRALAARVRADRAFQEALQDIGLAQLELAQAMSDAAGDSVGAAAKALEIAQQQLRNIQQNSPHDQAAILRAQADVVSSQAALRDADLNERQRAIDVAMQLEQITVGQAIAQLQALLSIPQLTKEQTDNILLKIKSLKDELGQDFRFNLPSDLYLPTAYEVRRMSQTPEGSGYNDNRVISVEVNVDTNADAATIASAVATAVGQPNRQGTQTRRY